jgi:hypothetical protein
MRVALALGRRGHRFRAHGVPHLCHDKRKPTVMSSHSKALETASEPGSSRSAPIMK